MLKAVLADAVAASGVPPFAAAVAFCPAAKRRRTARLGHADPDRRERWTERVNWNGHVLLCVFPGALHGFDTAPPIHTYVGHRLGGNHQAASDADAAVRAFLTARLARPDNAEP